MLYREAYRMLCDSFEAEDAVQNLYVKLWEKKKQLDAVDVPPISQKGNDPISCFWGVPFFCAGLGFALYSLFPIGVIVKTDT